MQAPKSLIEFARQTGSRLKFAVQDGAGL